MRDRRAAERHGHRAERIAALYLQLKGYRILERRFRTPVGEIDLIVRRGRLIAFVEVKARQDTDSAVLAVSPTARRRILRAAEWFLASRPEAAGHDLRFDIVALAPRRWPLHLADAFALDR